MKLSSDSGSTAIPLLDETISANLARTVAEHGGNDALVSVEQGLRYSYREFDTAVAEVATGLMAIGVDKGDRVGIWSPNCAEWVLVQYATAQIGGHIGDDQSGIPDSRVGVCAEPVGDQFAGGRGVVLPQRTTEAWSRRCGTGCRPGGLSISRPRIGTACWPPVKQ